MPILDIGFIFGDEIENIDQIELSSGKRLPAWNMQLFFPVNLYVA